MLKLHHMKYVEIVPNDTMIGLDPSKIYTKLKRDQPKRWYGNKTQTAPDNRVKDAHHEVDQVP